MSNEKGGKVNRILTIYEMLRKEELVNKKQMSILFGVSEKTVQRDINDIKTYFCNNKEYNGNVYVKYRRGKKGYCISEEDDNVLTKKDVLAITKILLESRAFNKEEMHHLINTITGKINCEQRKYVRELIGNEVLNFVPLKHNCKLLSKIWKLSEFIRHKDIIEISYVKADGAEVDRTLNPVGIIFSEYYFYLIAYFNDLTFDNPAIFRIDRIKKYVPTGNKFFIRESARFEDGEFRKKIQFMYQGNLMKIKFEFCGSSLEAVLDRLPTAKVLKKYDDKYLIEAEVFGKGIIMWILSQGSKLKVISPNDFVKEVASKVKKISELY